MLQNISRRPGKSDLALASVNYRPTRLFSLADAALLPGAAVCMLGYPLSNLVRLPDGTLTPMLEPRYLQGYVTEACERNMPTPEGLRGAALLKRGSMQAVGVIYGTNEVALIKHFERIDTAGRREPEVQRVVTFGLAAYTSSLRTLSGPATNGLPLAKFVGQVE